MPSLDLELDDFEMPSGLRPGGSHLDELSDLEMAGIAASENVLSKKSFDQLSRRMRRDQRELLKRLESGDLDNHISPPCYQGPAVHAGFDAEWVQRFTHGRPWNEVLCITMVIECAGRYSRFIYTPPGPRREDRPTMAEFVQKALRKAMRERVVLSMPDQLLVFGHFMRGDLATFSDFWAHKREFRGLGKTLVSRREGHDIGIAPDKPEDSDAPNRGWSGVTHGVCLRALDRTLWRVRLRFMDTIKLTPGQKGLAYAAELMGKRKLCLHDDLEVPRAAAVERAECAGEGLPAVYGIDRMDLIKRDYPAAFEAYAFRDAEIALEYGLFMRNFVREQLGLDRLPATIAGCAAARIRKLAGGGDALSNLVGRTTVSQMKFNEARRGYVTRKVDRPVTGLGLLWSFAQKFYHGGRNECFYHGPTSVRPWYDFDLPGAYTTALVGLRPLDYEAAYQELDPDAYGIDDMGLAWITFEFPSGTRFPCIPVRGGSNTLFFPLKGGKEDQVFVGAPEIVLARRMGADIKVIQGFKVPWKSDSRIFEPFTREVQSKRREFPKDTHRAFNELWKEVGNSGYGLMAQGLRDKRAFDPATMRSQPVGLSALTEPFMAAWVTSFIRAVLGEILAGVPKEATVISATTDGLLVDVPMDRLKLDGPLCTYFADLREKLFGAREVLDPKPKHGALQLISVAVRTTFTARRLAGYLPVCAKGGVKPPCKPSTHNKHMLRLYISQPKTIVHEQLISAREQLMREVDLISIERTRRLNLTYDFKRRPCDARMVQFGHRERVAWDTVPWNTVQEAEFARARLSGWRDKRDHGFYDLRDYEDWSEEIAAALAAKEAGDAVGWAAPPVRADNAWGVLKRVFLQAGRRGEWGVCFQPRELSAIARMLTDAGFDTGKEDITYAGRRALPLIPHCVALTDRTLALLNVIISRFPTFDYRQVFRVADWELLEARLTAIRQPPPALV